MQILVVGDVHGCYFTFRNFLRKHWNPENTFLVQLGDLVNKGKHSARVLKKAAKLKKKYPHLVFFLLGNHEYMISQSIRLHGRLRGFEDLKQDLSKNQLSLAAVDIWCTELKPLWENKHVYISHAGIYKHSTRPLELAREDSIIHNRRALRNIDKLQVAGHVVQPAHYNRKENAWHIDSGAYLGDGLSGVLMNYDGSDAKLITEPTHPKDL
jgi:serine/threonine protein phosphatase 1